MDDSGSVYTGILSYGTGFFLLLLVLVLVIVWRMKMPNKKAMNTPTVQKVDTRFLFPPMVSLFCFVFFLLLLFEILSLGEKLHQKNIAQEGHNLAAA